MKKSMSNQQKRTIAIVLGAILLVAAGLLVVRNGILTRPTAHALSAMTEVPKYDILTAQYDREQEILADYAAGDYTMDAPYVIVDPYDMNPCSALVLFHAENAGSIRVTIPGKDDYSTISYTKTCADADCEIPIIGLYCGAENQVTLTDDAGNSVTIPIKTEPLPVDFQVYKLVASKPAAMEPGVTLMIACFEHSYTALIDCNADVRGYLSHQTMAHGTSIIQLNNGNMLSTGDEYKQIPYNMNSLWEFNWLGKVFREYEVPNAVHHDISELPDGDILAVSNNVDMFTSGTREDTIIVIDRETGSVIRSYDFRKILDEKRDPYHHFHPNILNPPNIDWMHTNAALYDKDHNALIVSSPTQSMVVSLSLDTGSINWILGPHEGYEGSSAYLAQYLLTPAGDGFEWQWCQHAPSILPDTDNNPDTIDLILFDNGQSKSFDQKNAVPPEENYSRGVCYRIDTVHKTVVQLWEYGRERGSDCYATFLGDADYLSQTHNRLLCFGGQLRVDGKPVDDIVDGVFGDVVTNSRVVEVTEDHQVVFEVAAQENAYSSSSETYQAERLPLYQAQSFDYRLGETKGERLGSNDNNDVDPSMKAPALFIGKIGVSFNRIENENGRLVLDGILRYQGKTYMLARSVVILRSTENTYVYQSYNGMNGRFFASIDTTALPAGVYQLSIAGAVREGNDALSGKLYQGHVKTGYKITVP